ncbi:hypothetical protein CN387_16185 [Bacillus cereus]|uniref:hypothetical protein n=1 Tax=Bacillus cereus group TaxID=86661 RepID=UPI000BEDB886|nr:MULTISPECIES: hypothetical protein [Bacillus cereus group]PDY77444.1 hypothetical protein CON10_11580 [Bacillus cereus]PEB98780.1 hypothetical protein CON04_12405 [Bacillus cereus]PEC29241.1 hypothetical protein CON75_03485 [Bacillus thuringiensis]PEC87918.1 hypothetical protein CON02_28355 [Bacillus cereus]PEE08281.1 hypothetical protein CON52_31250 [Bacillus cereus]
MAINLMLVISGLIACVLIAYAHYYNKRLHVQEKYEIDNLIDSLHIPEMEEYHILFLSYDNYYFKNIDKLLETIDEKYVVILTAPIWLYKRKVKHWRNHMVIDSTDVESSIGYFKKYEYVHYQKDSKKLPKNDNAYFSLICMNKERKV